MEINLSSFEKRLLLKPCVFIDASVILASGVDGFEQENSCARYLAKANKEYKAAITKPLMGEIFHRLCKLQDLNVSYNAFSFIKNLLSEKKFLFIPHFIDEWSFNYLKDNCSIVPSDDRLHLVHVYASLQNPSIKQQLGSNVKFASLDAKLNNPEVIRKVYGRLGFQIINPQTIL